MDGEIATKDATALAAAIAQGELGSRELLDGYLERIERLDGPVGAVVTLDVERARAAAAAADEAVASGAPLGPLHGLPITVKDAIEVAGIRATGGSTALRDHVPAVDAPVVAALRAAGAIVFGKTNVPEWSGDLQTYNELFGTTSNPWDTSRVPGGSSGGPAAAVACGFTSFEIGTDIGGSIRGPAHCCGVFGLKPSFGVVPQRGYLDRVGGGTTDVDINVFGPIARSARDLDLLLGAIAGPAPELAPAWRLELPEPGQVDLGSLRVATWFEVPAVPMERAVLDRLQTAADALADAGAAVEAAHPPVDFDEQVALFQQMITGAISLGMPDDIGDAIAGSHRAWLAAEARRAAVRATWAAWFEGYDVLLCPVYATAAFPHAQEGTIFERTITIDGEVAPYLVNLLWNGFIGIVGLPAAVPPIGRTPDGLPVGVQCVTPFLHDRRAIAIAGALAERCGGYEPPPGFA